MIVTRNWLKEFASFEFTTEELAHRLTMAGLEVDAVERIGEGLDSVVVARLLAVDRHPDAERLTVCRVDYGGAEPVQIVCGAQNHRTGDLVALAQVGSLLPGDFKIKKSKIRGQESMGMLCSEKELGLAEDSEGILILPGPLPLGTPVFQALGLKDVRLDIGLTPNRPDCLSVVGVAREVAAMAGTELRLPKPEVLEEGAEIDSQTSVVIEEPELCPRYAARLIRGVKIGPSPDWMVRRLESIGQRSINNVVDVTNYVLMELGHPLHAFDFNRLRGRRILVRRAGEGERFTTLDSQRRDLTAQDLVICDAEGAVALAGIMGGENSEIQDDTVDVLLESAYFNPATIRRTSKRLGIHSESSHRFERGADINMVPLALDRAADLIRQTAGGTICRQFIDAHPLTPEPRLLTLRVTRANDLLGLNLDGPGMRRLLESIQIEILASDPESLQVRIPTFRPDLEREIDLIEEVARLNGYDHIPATMPESRLLSQQPEWSQELPARVRNQMVGLGFAEIINYSFIATTAFDRILLPQDDPRRQCVAILNPLTEEHAVMRTTLVASMLDSISRNLSYRTTDLRLFEMRPVFLPRAGELLADERLHLVAALTGQREALGWTGSSQEVDFFDLKGVVETLAETLGLQGVSWQPDAGESYLHPGKSARILGAKGPLGSAGEIHPKVLKAYDISQPVYLLDLDLKTIAELGRKTVKFKPLSKFPDVLRDSAILVAESVSAGEVLETIHRSKPSFAEEVVLFDVYRGQGVGEGMKSLAFRVRYRSAEKTFTDEEINRAHARIVAALEKQLGANLR